MSEYSGIKMGKLKLKGEKRKKHKKSKSEKSEDKSESKVDFEDATLHGEWFLVQKPEQITGSICIEFGPHQYVRALDNGLLILGAPHSPGEGPDQEEIFVAIRASSNQFALKTGYNKYLSVDGRHRVVGHSDAVGEKEQFDPVFQDGKLAIMGPNQCFLSIDEDNDELPYLISHNTKATSNEMVKLRTNINPELTRIERLKSQIPDEEKGSLRDCEINYMRLNSDSTDTLQKAKGKGKLHEELLDRRSKMKSDKFCK
ncbi:Protein frg1 [Blomia tropicalis]|nr:Protein frg1 [Blomia tropicalis]